MSRRGPRFFTFDPDAIRLGEADVRVQFDPATFQRGEDYQRQGRVFDLSLDCRDDQPKLEASVRGSGGAIYRVDIDLTPTADSTVCEGFCTCPVETDCKHVVATLLEAIRKNWFESAPLPPARARNTPSPKKAAAPVRVVDPLAGPLGDWLDRLGAAAGQPEVEPGKAPPPESLLYCFDIRRFPNGAVRTSLAVVAARPLKAGGWGAGRPARLSTIAQSGAGYVTDTDRIIAKVLMAGVHLYMDDWPESGAPETLDWAMERILATGRARWGSKDGATMLRGPDRPGRLGWRLTETGSQLPELGCEEDGLAILPGPSPWVVDPATGATGKLLLPLPPEMVKPLLLAPPVLPEAAPALVAALARRFPGLPIAAPRADITVVADSSPPVPVLRLASRLLPPHHYWGRSAPTAEERVDGVWLSFDYSGREVTLGTPVADIRIVAGNTVTVRKRRPDIERAALNRLARLGLSQPDFGLDGRLDKVFEGGGLSVPLARSQKSYGQVMPVDPFAWPVFVHEQLPRLIADGWRVAVDESFRHRTIRADGDWQAEIEDKGGWWFSLDLGIEVAGERIALLPVLIAALARLKPEQPLESLSSAGTLYCPMADGRILALPFERVRSLVEVLVELFGDRQPGQGTAFDLTLAQAMGLDAIAEATRLRWVGARRLRDLVGHLRQEDIGAGDRPVPPGFTAELRAYQRVGFGWMRFLAEQGLGGVLADDMGLGKTVQTLAHILAEKTAGEMTAPFLVVAPTSLVATWRDEAARFAPDLNVLIMHGQGRPRDAEAFAGADLVVTTYPLLPRDGELLTTVDWHGVILDEAQAIKNPAARWTQVACRLRAGHRLCLTGTPVENHLGEAWSLFTFLMPGLLGDAKSFGKIFRTPIEKKNDGERRQLLSRRLKPFLLRRTKAEVAAELPPKTEIVRWIDLAGGQRDLYETLRLAMDEKVRQVVAAKGLARSSIIILDALLKLRQACCDPRLVRLKGARKSDPGSAKLEYLMEVLPSLIEEGRRILLFSQFTVIGKIFNEI